MEVRFKKKSDLFNIVVTVFAAVISVGMMIYGVFALGFKYTWPELVLNVFYIACIVMMWMYFFSYRLTTQQFNYWCSVCLGITVLLRDIIFAPPLPFYSLRLSCLTLSVLMLILLTYFYARRDWESYSRRKLWTLCIIDLLIATLYNIDILLLPQDIYTPYSMVEIWIRPTITYGLVACFVNGKEEKTTQKSRKL